ncbi:MAG: Na/Pi symporter [bacterium]|nr:Na/Pi symporter [bacterium]
MLTTLHLIGLLGGLALMLYGIEQLSEGMQALTGARTRALLRLVVRHRLLGVLVGIVITFLVQSSSASTVLFVSLVQSGVLLFRDTIALTLGAMVGTTLTVQLIAFRVTEYALACVALGFLLRATGRRYVIRHWAEIVMGTGLLFYGIGVMSTSVAPLRSNSEMVAWLSAAARAPWLAFAVAAAFTALVQASSASIALVFSFAAGGLLGDARNEIMQHALPYIFGANVGTTVTALMAAIRTSRDALRCAVAHAVIKTVAAVVCMFAITPLALATTGLTDWLWRGTASVERLIANGHTLFNMLNVIVCLPFVNSLARAFTWLIPPAAEEHVFPALRLTPERASEIGDWQQVLEALAMSARMVRDMAQGVAQQCEHPDVDALEELSASDERMDRGYHEIRQHALLRLRLPGATSGRQVAERVLRSAEVLERLADDLTRSVPRSFHKMVRQEVMLSVEDRGALRALLRGLGEAVGLLADALVTHDRAALDAVMRARLELHQRLASMRRAHFQAVSDGVPAALRSSEYFLDVLSELESSLNKLGLLAQLTEELAA